VALGIAGFIARTQMNGVTAAGQTSFLPADSESTRAVDALQQASSGGEEVPVVIVFERRGGLTKADLRAIGRLGEGLNRLRLTGATPTIDPFSGEHRRLLGVQIGATVAFGVLLDTFLVRALLIPAITYRLGDRAWWPTRSRRDSY
jgi:uncharacterized membrane protein YdfJ with MMPL/SSD domain